MISFSLALTTSFTYGHQVTFPAFLSSHLSGKLFYPVKKDAFGRLQAFEHTKETDARTQPLKNADALPLTVKEISTFDLPLATYDAVSSRKERNTKRVGDTAAQNETSGDYDVIKYALRTEAAIKAISEFNTLVFVVDKRADKKVIRDTVTKTFMVKAKKVNTSIMPDGKKKAFVILAPECNALDVAKKFKIL